MGVLHLIWYSYINMRSWEQTKKEGLWFSNDAFVCQSDKGSTRWLSLVVNLTHTGRGNLS